MDYSVKQMETNHYIKRMMYIVNGLHVTSISICE